MSVAFAFSSDGPIAHTLPSFEPRSQQVDMARAIEEAIEKQEHLLVEAGTGTGKSLAYLVPFIEWAVREKKRVIISTYTKTLQHQLIEHDLPFLKRALGLDFSYALCLGTGNYVCPRRLARAQELGLFVRRDDTEQLSAIYGWARRTRTGIMSDLDFVPSPGVWNQVNRDPDLCNGQECDYYDECPFYLARKRQFASHILVANHHLFFANLATNYQVLPPFEAVVLDEAHNLEEVAAEFLGISIANTQLAFLFDSIRNERTGRGFLPFLTAPEEQHREIEASLAECRSALSAFSNAVEDLLQSRASLRLRQADMIEHGLEEPLLGLSQALRSLLQFETDEESRFEIERIAARSEILNGHLREFISQTRKNHVYWITAERTAGARRRGRGRAGSRLVLNAAPIDLSDHLREKLFERFNPIVLTSATLTTANSFDYLKSRLGVGQVRALSVGSPFDFAKQAMLYIPQDLPEPSRKDGAFEAAAIERAAEIIEITRGGAFILCTSHEMVARTYEELSYRFQNSNTLSLQHPIRLLKQGDMPRERLLEEFKSHSNAVLVATATFWQGIDVPGEKLRCVILMRLPFAVPDEPLVQARMEHLEVNGMDPFVHYQLPQAIILFRQGFGRLIRTKDDYGLVAVLDPRVVTKRYGREFLNSLPACSRAYDLKDVAIFFRNAGHVSV